MKGWIALHRCVTQKVIWQKSTPEQKVILVALITLANHDVNEWEWQGEKFKVKPGQFITSLNTIVKTCGRGISLQNVRSSLKRFEKLGFLTNQSTKTGRLITLVNWHLYQVELVRTNKDDNKEVTKNQQSGNKEVTSNNNDKHLNNDQNDNKLKDTSSNTFSDDSLQMSLVNKLLFLIRVNNPNFKEPNIQKWAKDFDSIIRIDKRDLTEIERVISWSQQDNFWKSNILSPSKLRDKYDTLYIQMTTKKSPAQKQDKPRSWNAIDQWDQMTEGL